MVVFKLLRNKAITFVIFKYITFGIQLMNSVLMAKFLGVYFFGLYGLITLVLQYLSYTNLGVQYSYSVLCSDKENNKTEIQRKITNTSINLLIVLSVLLILTYSIVQYLNLFSYHYLSKYFILILIISLIQYFNTLFINVFRLNGKVHILNIYYLLVPLFQLMPILFFKEETLLYYLLYALVGASFISLIMFLLKFPKQLLPVKLLDFLFIKTIILRGVFLLLYNFTFIGILLTAKTIVSYYFDIKEFGLFNFANSIANSVFLLLGSLNFLFYPKLINILSSKRSNIEISSFIEKIRMIFLSLTLFIVFVSLLIFPILFYFLPQYKDSFSTLQFLLLSQLIINNSFGYSTLLVQRAKEFQMTLCALASIFLILFFSYFGLQFYYSIEMVAISVLVGVIFYNLFITILGSKLINQHKNWSTFLFTVFSPSLFLPIFICTLLMIFSSFYLINIFISFFIYLLLNKKNIKFVIRKGLAVLIDKKYLSVN